MGGKTLHVKSKRKSHFPNEMTKQPERWQSAMRDMSCEKATFMELKERSWMISYRREKEGKGRTVREGREWEGRGQEGKGRQRGGEGNGKGKGRHIGGRIKNTHRDPLGARCGKGSRIKTWARSS